MRFIVIIPTFNEAENLPDCLESIREATLPLPTSADVAAASTESVTVVVSDGGSSDGSENVEPP
jgi:glycosyltransferase involved in cell wall biosynthesis